MLLPALRLGFGREVAMRLLVLSDALAPHTQRWATWFANRGHEVHVVSFNAEVLTDYAPAHVHVLWESDTGGRGSRIRRMVTVQHRLRRLLRDLAPDVIHAHSVGGYAWAARWTGFQPFVLTPWGTDILVDIQESRVNRLLTTSALRKAPLVVTDGQHFVDILVGLGVARERIEVLTFGTDTTKFSGRADPARRRELGFDDCNVVISTRTPNPVHDVGCFVRAIPDILAKCSNTRFIVVGDGTERESLEELAHELGVTSRVRFTGMVGESEMRELLSVSDVYVSTSLMDAGLAGSTAEAMAMSLPIVQTDNSDNRYWAPPGVGGYLFENGASAHLAEAVAKLLADPQERSEMGARNREMVCREYDTDIQMAKMEEFYFALIDR